LQILEHQAACASKSQELKVFLGKCMEESTLELNDLAEGDAGALVHKLKGRFERIESKEAEKKDASILFRMAAANVGRNDPEFSRRLGKLLPVYLKFHEELCSVWVPLIYKCISIPKFLNI
jgi:hypothetical protein